MKEDMNHFISTNYRKFKQYDEVHICNSSIGSDAFEYYFENRYSTYKECLNPCKIMAVKVTSTFKMRKKNNFDVQFYIPRQVEVTREVFVKSVLSLGKVILSNW